jgi:hypothetical protein
MCIKFKAKRGKGQMGGCKRRGVGVKVAGRAALLKLPRVIPNIVMLILIVVE